MKDLLKDPKLNKLLAELNVENQREEMRRLEAKLRHQNKIAFKNQPTK